MFVWLSFCDPQRAKGTQFLAVAIVEVPSADSIEAVVRAAISKAHRLGINPGGEVMSYEVPEEVYVGSYADKLLQKPEIEALERILRAAARPSAP